MLQFACLKDDGADSVTQGQVHILERQTNQFCEECLSDALTSAVTAAVERCNTFVNITNQKGLICLLNLSRGNYMRQLRHSGELCISFTVKINTKVITMATFMLYGVVYSTMNCTCTVTNSASRLPWRHTFEDVLTACADCHFSLQ